MHAQNIYDVARKFCNSGRCVHNFTIVSNRRVTQKDALRAYRQNSGSTAVPPRGGVKPRERSLPWRTPNTCKGRGTIKASLYLLSSPPG